MITLHLVSHTHWDREWYQTFQQFRLKLVDLIDSLLDILDGNSHYEYFMLDGQTIVLQDYLELRPEMKSRLIHHIRSGRLIIGPWYILPDEFLVSPEATIRNLLQGDQICRDFGPKMKIGYIPDPFGHIGQMPQILNGFGIDTAVFRRGLSIEPCELWWQAPDGSRVFVSYMRDGYDNAAGLPVTDPDLFIQEVRRLRDSLKPFTASSHLLLMQGTDHMRPIPETPDAIKATRGKLEGDKLVHSTLQEYLTSVQNSLGDGSIPVVSGELRSPQKHHLLPGVLSTRMWIKQRNHHCESMLEKWAEPFSTMACLVASNNDMLIRDPGSILQHTWSLLMQNHPHDSICGCSIDQVHEEMRVRFDQVDQLTEEIIHSSLQSLTQSINTSPEWLSDCFSSVIIFNPTFNERTELVTIQFSIPQSVANFELVDSLGKFVPYELQGSDSSELINFLLPKEELLGMIGNIHDGVFADYSVQSMEITREGLTDFISAQVAKNSTPNPLAWQKGLESIKIFINDPSIENFHIRARNPKDLNISFVASGVPQFGWKAYFLRSIQPDPVTLVKVSSLRRILASAVIKISQTKLGRRLINSSPGKKVTSARYIENEFFRLKVDSNGTFILEDKRTGKIHTDLNKFLDGGDAGDEYNFCPPEFDQVIPARLHKSTISLNKIQQSLTVDLILDCPAELTTDRKARSARKSTIRIRTTASLVPGVPRLDIHTEVENTASDHRLRVHFPFKTQATDLKAIHDGHFEIVSRPIGKPGFEPDWVEQPRSEVPQREFSDISDSDSGLLVANRGLPEVEVLRDPTGGQIALTLLRCVGWLSRDDFSNRKGHAGPFLPTPGAQMQGKWDFHYSIIPHSGNFQSLSANMTPLLQASDYVHQLRATTTGIHSGRLPNSGSFIQVNPASIKVSAIKQTTAEDQWLVRGYNLSASPAEITITPWIKFKEAWLANLAEESISRLQPDKTGAYSISVRPHELITLKFKDG